MAIWELGSVYSVGRDEILRTIKNRKGAMVVMLDSCQSGASVDASVPTGSAVDMNRLVNELGDKTLGVFLYASALGRQFLTRKRSVATAPLPRR